MYADEITGSMKRAIGETERRRKIQTEYNKEHGIIPKTIVKEVKNTIGITGKKSSADEVKLKDIPNEIEKLKALMKVASAQLDFEKAIEIRDTISELKKKFKMNGIILADVKVVKMMDKKLKSGASNLIPEYIDKEGNLSKKSNAVTKEQFEDLQKYTAKIIKEISQEILSGDISLKPYYNIKTKKKPCDYCEYKSICQFDAGQNGNNYNYISKMEKDEILEKIKNVK